MLSVTVTVLSALMLSAVIVSVIVMSVVFREPLLKGKAQCS